MGQDALVSAKYAVRMYATQRGGRDWPGRGGAGGYSMGHARRHAVSSGVEHGPTIPRYKAGTGIRLSVFSPGRARITIATRESTAMFSARRAGWGVNARVSCPAGGVVFGRDRTN